MFFYHCFVAFVCIFLVFFEFSHLWTSLKLLWRVLHRWRVLNPAGRRGGCSSTCYRRWRPAAVEAWPNQFLANLDLPDLPANLDISGKGTSFFFPFRDLKCEGKSPPNENQFSIFFLSWRWGQKPAKQNRFFSACFSSQKNVFQFHLFAFLLPFYYFVETSEVSCFKIFIVLFNSSIKLTEPLLYNHDIMISWLSHCSSNIFPTFLPRNWSRARPLGCSRPWMSGPSAPCRGRVVQYFTWGMIWLVPI
jgi:hypothetical protein